MSRIILTDDKKRRKWSKKRIIAATAVPIVLAAGGLFWAANTTQLFTPRVATITGVEEVTDEVRAKANAYTQDNAVQTGTLTSLDESEHILTLQVDDATETLMLHFNNTTTFTMGLATKEVGVGAFKVGDRVSVIYQNSNNMAANVWKDSED